MPDVTTATQLKGTGVSPGIALGPLVRMGVPVIVVDDAPPAAPDEGRAAVALAMSEVAEDLGARRDRAKGEAVEVLESMIMMSQDPALTDRSSALLDEGATTTVAVTTAINEFRDMLLEIGGYLGERAADLDDLRLRIVARLHKLPMPGIPHREHPFVLVADDLAPADTVDLDPTRVAGLVTEHGGPTSHTAIIARSLGMPAIVSCEGILDVAEGSRVLVDGRRGTVTVAPDQDTINAATARAAAHVARVAGSTGPGRTADDHAVQLLVNVGVADSSAATVDSEGVGLLRTELLFLGRTDAPTLEEQTTTYRDIFTSFSGRKVVVRTLDIGADKPLPFVQPGPGENPALGLRGWRLKELEPDLITTQLTAIGDASKDAPCDVWVMAPMIATAAEAEAFASAARAAGIAKVGVMVEVPSLALRTRDLVGVVDFVSLGTNDLSQYTFAADRQVGELGHLLTPWQPALLELVARTASAGTAGEMPVGVCGEAAADPLLAVVLTGLGCSSLSMAGPAVAEVRAMLADVTLDDCRRAAEIALEATTPTAARTAVQEFVAEAAERTSAT